MTNEKIVNKTHFRIDDAVRALRKRLSQQNAKKDNHGTELTLTVSVFILNRGIQNQ